MSASDLLKATSVTIPGVGALQQDRCKITRSSRHSGSCSGGSSRCHHIPFALRAIVVPISSCPMQQRDATSTSAAKNHDEPEGPIASSGAVASIMVVLMPSSTGLRLVNWSF
jgi:hypothetical protein